MGNTLSRHDGRILFIYSPASTHVLTTFQYVDSFRKHSRFKIDYISCFTEELLDFSQYDSVWVSYCARLVVQGAVSEALKKSIKEYNGPKFIEIQDEYDNTNLLHEELRFMGPTNILTCAPADGIKYVYPEDLFPGVKFDTVLTGYVPDELGGARARAPLSERPVHVGYRGRTLSWRYGELARQKWEVGVRLREACQRREVPCDIGVDEASRIYGFAWFDFIRSCRAMLGSESGSNVFDFDGSIAARVAATGKEQPDETCADIVAVIAAREQEIRMGQISPRIFEAAALGTALVLMRGSYSGTLEAETHYVPIEPDYSNLDEVLDRIQNIEALQAMADRARRHLIESGAYSYAAFIRRMDDLIDDAISKKPGPHPAGSGAPVESHHITDRAYGNDPFVIKLLQDARALYRQIDDAQAERSHYAKALDEFAARYNALNEKFVELKQLYVDEVGKTQQPSGIIDRSLDEKLKKLIRNITRKLGIRS